MDHIKINYIIYMFLSTFFATLVGLIFQPLLNFFTKLAEKRSNVKSFSAELLFNIKMLEDREKALNEAKEAISCLTIDKNKKYDLAYKYSNGLFLEYLKTGFIYKIIKSPDNIVSLAEILTHQPYYEENLVKPLNLLITSARLNHNNILIDLDEFGNDVNLAVTSLLGETQVYLDSITFAKEMLGEIKDNL